MQLLISFVFYFVLLPVKYNFKGFTNLGIFILM